MDHKASFQLSRKSLRVQCEVLGLPLNRVRMNYTGRPEVAMLERFVHSGAEIALFDEGKSIHGLLHAALMPLLYPLGVRRWGPEQKYVANGYIQVSGVSTYLYLHYGAFTELLSDHPNLPNKMVKTVAESTTDTIHAGWSKIRSWNRDNKGFQHLSLTVSPQQMVRLYEIVTRSRLVRIMQQLLVPPFVFGFTGWPDLTIVNDNHLSLVEVKTKDRLHHQQIITISDMKDAAELDISVVQVIRTNVD